MKRLPALVALLLFTYCCFAQKGRTNANEARRKLVFGFKAGLNRSNIFDQRAQNFVADARTGAVAGAFMAFPFGQFIGFQPEVHISQKGFAGRGMFLTEEYTITRTTTHLDIPLQLQLKPFSFLSMLGGVQYSYLLRQKDEFSRGDYYEQINQQFRNDDLRKNLLGLIIGVDVNFWHVVLSARAGWDLVSNHGDGTSSTPRYKNTWLQGTIAYRIY